MAVLTGGLAIATSGISPFLPDGLLASLHDSRAVSASRAEFEAAVAQLSDTKAQIAELTKSQQTLQETSAALGTQFSGFVQQAGGVRSRVETIEKTLPRLTRALHAVEPSDPTVITGSISKPANASSFDAPGGSVTVSERPLPLPTGAPPTGGMPANIMSPAEAMPAMPGSVGESNPLPLQWPVLR